MEIVTKEPLKILSQLFIPLILVTASGIITAQISKYSKIQDKNQHIRFLRKNYSKIDLCFNSIKNRRVFQIGLSPMYFMIGVTLGVAFELFILKLTGKILDYTWEIDYIKKTLPFSYDIVGLNAVLFICSYLNISIIIILVIWEGWCRFLESKKLTSPKITEHYSIKTSPDFPSIKVSSDSVYFSFWIFLGSIVGIDIFIYYLTFYFLIMFSIIPNDFSFNWIIFVGICEKLKTSVPYLNYYIFVFFMGAAISFLHMTMVYQSITWFSSSVKQLIADFYKYEFPEVKIITEHGEIKGQLRDVQNKSQVTLIENGIMKTVSWDKIEIMEVGKKT